MNDPFATAESKDSCIDSALREYLERVDRGETLDRENFIAQHSEIAEELRSFIAAEEQLRKLAGAERVEKSVENSTQSFALRGQETIVPQAGAERIAEGGGKGLTGEFGRYRIVRALGQGAMGTVYLAEDTQLQRQVALKTPHFAQEPTPELLERFYREARAAATLRHSNICPVFDVGQIEGTHYISMAFIEGHPLSAFIRSAKPQPERQVLIVIRKLAQALQEAHDHGIVHRDLKPANIMVDKRNEPVIMDFGLARQLRGETNIRITQSGMLIGTPAYMSPEQVDGEPDKVGPLSDQYSLGVILYELLTGQLPFRGSLTAVMAQILTKETTAPSQLRPGLDARIEAACLKMMAKLPADRFASLSAAAVDFAAILRSPGAKPASKGTGGPVGTVAPAARATQTSELKGATSSILQSLTKKSVSGENLASLEELARKCLARHDYDQVIQIIDRIPEEKRNAGLVALLEKCRTKADEIAFLICEIDEAVRFHDRATALRKADELLKIKPAHHRALKVQEAFAGYSEGSAARLGPLRQFTQPWNEGGWIPWSVLAFGLAIFAGLTAIVVIYLNGTAVEVDIKDPGIAVTLKGKEITITGPKDEKIVVEPGEQQLKITYAGLETVTTSFSLKKGEKRILTVSIVNKEILAKLDSEILSLTRTPERAKEKKREIAVVVPGGIGVKQAAVAESDHPPLLVAPFDVAAAKNARQQWADHLKRPGEVTNAIDMKLALIPPGEFHMGSADPRLANDARPLHRVRITKPFYLGVYEVTQAEFQRITGANPSHFHDDPRLPVESISWDDCQNFLHKLNAMPEEQRSGRTYRLPTEAEWEYACRAGTETLFSAGDLLKSSEANFDGNQQPFPGFPKGTRLNRTTRVGSYPANAFGLYDINGNVLEGVADWYSPDYYASSPVDDPKGPAAGDRGTARGGSWHSPATPSAVRVAGPRSTRSDEVGFRVACDILPVESAAPANALAAAASARVSDQQGFVPLFNGKDLSGWKTAVNYPGNWRVENGVLVGSKAPFGFLHTVRDDFTDFHLRVEARLNDGGNSGVIIRGNRNFYGYEADLNNPRDTGSNRTGSLWTERETLAGFFEPLVPPGQWFTLDVIAEGNHIVVQVNGRTTADYTDEKRRSTRGPINLQQAHEETVVEFRKIEIKELGSPQGNSVTGHAGKPASSEVTAQSPAIDLLDAIMLDCGKKIGCSGATLTIARGDQILYARGYGSSDRDGKVPIQPDTPMCISGCDTPFIAAAVRQLAQEGKLDLNASVFKLLKIKPARRVVDHRVWNITINHLLEQKAGWQGKPIERARKAASNKKHPVKAETVLAYVMCEKLAWTPGTKGEFDWFGFDTLRRVIARASGRGYIDYLRFELCRPYGIQELKWIRDAGPRRKGEPPRLWNGLIMEDVEDYRMGVSTPAVCTFMRFFWIDGKPRDNGNPLWIRNGRWSNSSTSMIWRSDGINIAWSFNGAGDADPGEALWLHAIDQLKKEHRLPD